MAAALLHCFAVIEDALTQICWSKCRKTATSTLPAKQRDTDIARGGVQVVALGSDKAELTVSKTFILSLLAGVYISFGGMLAISVGGACAGLAQVGLCTLEMDVCIRMNACAKPNPSILGCKCHCAMQLPPQHGAFHFTSLDQACID